MNMSKKIAAVGSGDGAEICTEPGYQSIVSTPAAATQATVTAPALTGNGRHVCKAISAAIAAGATAQTPIRAVLRDGATGVGTILWSKKLSAPVNQCASVDLSGLSIVGSPNTAMTLEFVAAGVAASEEDVTLGFFDLLEGVAG